jgi:hypothetical protein
VKILLVDVLYVNLSNLKLKFFHFYLIIFCLLELIYVISAKIIQRERERSVEQWLRVGMTSMLSCFMCCERLTKQYTILQVFFNYWDPNFYHKKWDEI